MANEKKIWQADDLEFCSISIRAHVRSILDAVAYLKTKDIGVFISNAAQDDESAALFRDELLARLPGEGMFFVWVLVREDVSILFV